MPACAATPPGWTSWNIHLMPSPVSAFMRVAAIAILPAARARFSWKNPVWLVPSCFSMEFIASSNVSPLSLPTISAFVLLAQSRGVRIWTHELLVHGLQDLGEHFTALGFGQELHGPVLIGS